VERLAKERDGQASTRIQVPQREQELDELWPGRLAVVVATPLASLPSSIDSSSAGGAIADQLLIPSSYSPRIMAINNRLKMRLSKYVKKMLWNLPEITESVSHCPQWLVRLCQPANRHETSACFWIFLTMKERLKDTCSFQGHPSVHRGEFEISGGVTVDPRIRRQTSRGSPWGDGRF